ncbi:MAG: hypothetical protein KC609_09415 [Myxococcales bacterium]|nr:hypothetical protein [Myxococcales bacterium]
MAKTALELTVDLIAARLTRIPMQAVEISAMLDALYPQLKALHDQDRAAAAESAPNERSES